ncbi:hypothetical protein [Pedomonas sp. V897]|uniref:hypothetical protein n=1 Tax=Pedomonas sp. V897 TaxID=3446482 RepID=UPI003EDFC5C1
MPATRVDLLMPHMRQGPASTIRVEADAHRNNTSLFGELVDTVNPLQHVPVVSQAYRAVTKDKISDGAKFAGHVGLGAAVAGPVGAAVGVGVYLIEGLFGALFGGSKGKKGGEDLVQAGNVKSGPTAFNGDQAIHAGKTRPGLHPAATQSPKGAQAPKDAQAPVATGAASSPARPVALPGSAPVEMSSDQFAALMTAFGASAPAAMPAPARGSEERQNERPNERRAERLNERLPERPHPVATAPAPAMGDADFAARMAANLDKLDALKRSQQQGQ